MNNTIDSTNKHLDNAERKISRTLELMEIRRAVLDARHKENSEGKIKILEAENGVKD